jgi:hypothetical protein
MQDGEPREGRVGLFEGGKKGYQMRKERVSAAFIYSALLGGLNEWRLGVAIRRRPCAAN